MTHADFRVDVMHILILIYMNKSCMNLLFARVRSFQGTSDMGSDSVSMNRWVRHSCLTHLTGRNACPTRKFVKVNHYLDMR